MGMKKEKLLTTLLSLIAIFFFGTFAYSFYELTDVGTVLTASISTGKVGVVFSDGTTQFQYKPLMAGGTAYKTFTIDNTTNPGNTQASIYFKNLKNTYMEGTLVYSLSYSTNPNGPYTNLVHNRNVPYSSSPSNQVLYGDVSVPQGQKYYYKLEISLKNYELVGTADVNASMSSMFYLELGHINESKTTLDMLGLTSKGEITDFNTVPAYCTNYMSGDDIYDCFTTYKECFDAELENIGEGGLQCDYNTYENLNKWGYSISWPNGYSGYCTTFLTEGDVYCFETQAECYEAEENIMGDSGYECNFVKDVYNHSHYGYPGVLQYGYQVYFPNTLISGVYEAEDNYGTSYYFRGDVDNNTVYLPVTLDGTAYYHEVGFAIEDGFDYVHYGPFDTLEECEAHEGKGLGDVASASCYESDRVEGLEFKIIRINGDGTLRLIRTGGILGSEAYENGGGTFGSIKYLDSNAQRVLENWYTEYLLSEYDNYISKSTMFCNDLNYYKNGYEFDSKFRVNADMVVDHFSSLYCNARKPGLNMGNSQLSVGAGLNYPVGLITSDEFILSGNANSYLKMEHDGWTMSPYSYYPDLEYKPYGILTFSSAGLGYYTEQYEEGGPSYVDFYPVINLTTDYVRTLEWNDSIKAYVDPNKTIILPPVNDSDNLDFTLSSPSYDSLSVSNIPKGHTVKYAEGDKNSSYFTSSGTTVSGSINVGNNGIYTFALLDSSNNVVKVKKYYVVNSGLLSNTDESSNYDTSVTVSGVTGIGSSFVSDGTVGAQLNGNSLKITANGATLNSEGGYCDWYCPNGGDLDGTSCVAEDYQIETTITKEIDCSSGEVLSEQCDGNCNESCSDGYSKIDGESWTDEYGNCDEDGSVTYIDNYTAMCVWNTYDAEISGCYEEYSYQYTIGVELLFEKEDDGNKYYCMDLIDEEGYGGPTYCFNSYNECENWDLGTYTTDGCYGTDSLIGELIGSSGGSSGDWCHTYFDEEYCYETYDECYEGYEEHSEGDVTECTTKVLIPGYCTNYMSGDEIYDCFVDQSDCEGAEMDALGDTYQCVYTENVYSNPSAEINWPNIERLCWDMHFTDGGYLLSQDACYQPWSDPDGNLHYTEYCTPTECDGE